MHPEENGVKDTKGEGNSRENVKDQNWQVLVLFLFVNNAPSIVHREQKNKSENRNHCIFNDNVGNDLVVRPAFRSYHFFKITRKICHLTNFLR